MDTSVSFCEHCAESGGLCPGCAEHDKSILPQLAQPPYVKLIAAKRPPVERAFESPAPIPPLNTPGRRLARALRGERIRNRRRVA